MLCKSAIGKYLNINIKYETFISNINVLFLMILNNKQSAIKCHNSSKIDIQEVSSNSVNTINVYGMRDKNGIIQLSLSLKFSINI